MLKTLFFALACFLLVPVSTQAARYDTCDKKTFKVTAYYSPEEDQSFYVQGSYEADKILNGEGTHGASGMPVFFGMIAAPKTYTFGTRIYVPGRGIGQVEDRGGAIVVAGERAELFDRLDVWAGRGEAGLRLALRFGVRYLDAYVCPSYVGGDTLGFDFSHLPVGVKLPVSLRQVDLAPGSISQWTPILQRYLKVLGYLGDVEESIHYGDATKKAVCSYQQRVLGMSSESPRCGWFGPLTRSSFQKTVKTLSATGFAIQQEITTTLPSEKLPKQEQEISISSTKEKDKQIAHRLFVPGGEFYGYLLGPLAPGDTGKEVRILQRKLQRLGHYPLKTEITGVYDEQTIRSVYAFQLAQGLLTASVDPSVYGYFGPKTRSTLNSV